MTTNLAVVVRHIAFEDLVVLAPIFSACGYVIRYLDAGVNAIDDVSLLAADLVVLGEAIGVYETDRYPSQQAEQQAIDREARQTISRDLGHERMSVVAYYLGR